MTSPNLTKENYIKFIKSANEGITTELVENIYLQTKELIANYLQKGNEVDLFGCVKLKVKCCKARKIKWLQKLVKLSVIALTVNTILPVKFGLF